eukprot:3956205-Pleurochrysis_carterae.AAC.6
MEQHRSAANSGWAKAVCLRETVRHYSELPFAVARLLFLSVYGLCHVSDCGCSAGGNLHLDLELAAGRLS